MTYLHLPTLPLLTDGSYNFYDPEVQLLTYNITAHIISYHLFQAKTSNLI